MRRTTTQRTAGTLVVLASLSLWAAFPAQAQEPEWKRLNQEVLLLYKQGNYGQATTLATQALRFAEISFGPDHPAVALSLNNLAALYRDQGQYAQAEPLYKRSLAIVEKALGPDHPYVATSLNNLAALYQSEGRYAQAEPLYKRSLAIWEKAFGSDHPAVAASLGNLAELYRTQGRYAPAEPLLKRSLAIREKALGPDHPDVALSLNILAGLYDTQGQYAQAEPLFKRSLAIRERALGPDHPDVATSLNNLAGLHDTRGQYAQAEPLYRRSLAIVEKALGPVHPDVATSLNNLASLYDTQGQVAQAEPLYKRSLAIRETALGPDHPDVATSLNNLAALYRTQGHYAQAEPLFKRSLAIAEKALGPDHPDVATSLNNLALLYNAQSQYAQAEPLYKRSLAIREKVLGPDHPDVAQSLGNLAELYVSQSRLTEALGAIRQSTRLLARRIKTAAASVTSQVATGQAQGSDTFAAHATLIGKILPSSTVSDRPPLIAEAFAAAQHARMGDTGAALAQMAARASAGSGALAQKVREHQDAVASWRQFDKQLIDAIGKPATERRAGAEQALRRQLADTDARVARLDAELLSAFPEYRELVSPEPLAVVEAQKLLKPDEAMLTYLVAEKEILLWVIRPGRAEMIRLETGKDVLSRQVARLREGVDLSSGVLPEFPYATAHALYRILFAAAVPHLTGVKHALVVADGPLQSLPFGLLLSAAMSLNADAPWLIRQYAFTNLPAVTSLRALRRFGKERVAGEPFMGFGDPLLKGTPEEARGVSLAKLFARGALADTREVSRMARLPETADELQAIAKTLKASDNTVLLREAATERQVKSMNLASYRVLAFATHGLMSGDFKGLAEPALVLTPPETPSEIDDGLLTASEIAGLKLNADWVILSACNTAAADGKPGADGFSGLAKAFFYAGSRTLLVSHWAVASVATVALTTRMFAEAEKGSGPAEALQRSILVMIDHPTEAVMRHPAMWAPFVVVGEGMGVKGVR